MRRGEPGGSQRAGGACPLASGRRLWRQRAGLGQAGGWKGAALSAAHKPSPQKGRRQPRARLWGSPAEFSGRLAAQPAGRPPESRRSAQVADRRQNAPDGRAHQPQLTRERSPVPSPALPLLLPAGRIARPAPPLLRLPCNSAALESCCARHRRPPPTGAASGAGP